MFASFWEGGRKKKEEEERRERRVWMRKLSRKRWQLPAW
jgi:hypothetical protein